MVSKVADDIGQVWQVYKQDLTNQDLRNILIENYLPLVRYNAERVWAKLPDGVDLNDLMSAGVFGLIDAIEAFDMERGVKFETYCVPVRDETRAYMDTMLAHPAFVEWRKAALEEPWRISEYSAGHTLIESYV